MFAHLHCHHRIFIQFLPQSNGAVEELVDRDLLNGRLSCNIKNFEPPLMHEIILFCQSFKLKLMWSSFEAWDVFSIHHI